VLEEAGAYLESLINVERSPETPYAYFGLDKIQRLLDLVGNPERDLSVVHIAGSKGKGSTALWLESLLRAAGETVGTFTSPHLERWTERFRIQGCEVEEAQLAQVLGSLRPHVEALQARDASRAPSFFDVTTAAAFVLFKEAGVKRVILEVGLGGRLDSTNVVNPEVACITSIELEHTNRLGDTLAKIAMEKSGIIKPGRPVVVGALPREALDVVCEEARRLGAPLWLAGKDHEVEASAEEMGRKQLHYRSTDLSFSTPLPSIGLHQVQNAALAIACAQCLGDYEPAALEHAAREGFLQTRLPGRVEILGTNPVIIIDAAHTEASARTLVECLNEIPHSKRCLLLSISGDKKVGAVLRPLLEGVDRVITTEAEPARSLAAASLAAEVSLLAPEMPVQSVPALEEALEVAVNTLGAEDLLCVTGSVYLAGAARRVLRRRGLGESLGAGV
jgi:dihydrofolate synthase/folylpolyglutamate synthase